MFKPIILPDKVPPAKNGMVVLTPKQLMKALMQTEEGRALIEKNKEE